MKFDIETIEQPTVSQQEATQYAPLWNVVILNDPVNLTTYVTMVLKRVFGYNHEKATKLMLQVHHLGSSVVWSGDFEKAENYYYQLQQWQLTVKIEPYGQS